MNSINPEQLVKAVKQWGREKGINNPLMQYAKINEEIGELAHEVVRGHIQPIPTRETVDAIGDILVTVIIFADIIGVDPIEALSMSYDTIKERKGKTINGSFVKANE